MTLEGRGRVILQFDRRRNDIVAKCYLTVPLDVARDSQFPLKAGPVTIRIEGYRVVVESM